MWTIWLAGRLLALLHQWGQSNSLSPAQKYLTHIKNFKRLEKPCMKQPFGLKPCLRPEEMLLFFLSAFYTLLVPHKPLWQEGLTLSSTCSTDFPTPCFIKSNPTELQSLTHHGNPGQNITWKSHLALQVSQKTKNMEKGHIPEIASTSISYLSFYPTASQKPSF